MGVNVEPGTGEGGIVEITKLVTVTAGSLVPLEGRRVGEPELVSGGEEGDKESGGLEDGTVVGGKDEGFVAGGNDEGSVVGGMDGRSVVSGMDERSVVSGMDEISLGSELGENVRSDVNGREFMEEGREVEDVMEETEMLLGVDVGKIVSSVESREREGDRVKLGLVIEDGGLVTDEEMLGEMEECESELITEERSTEGDVEDGSLELDGETVELEGDNRRLLGSSEDVTDVIDRLLGKLEVELDGTGGLDIEIEGSREDVELKEVDKELGGGEDGGSESVEVESIVGKETEDGGVELESSVLGSKRAEGSGVLEDTLIGGLVDGGLSDVMLGGLDVDGGSGEDVDAGGLLEGGGGSVDGGTGGEDGGTSGVEVDAGGGVSVVVVVGTGGELGGGGGGGSLVTVTGGGF